MNTTSDDMSVPVASNLVLLGDLKTTAQGTKVRFLGWYWCRRRDEEQELIVAALTNM